MFRLLTVALFLAGFPICAQSCDASAEVQAAVQSGMKARDLREKFPSDYFAHRLYQEQTVRYGLYTKTIQDEYKVLWEQHPGDSTYPLLYARVLKGTDTKQALRLLEDLLTREPENPHAHLKMAEIFAAPNFGNPTKLRDHIEAYWKVCPDSLMPFSNLRTVRDAAFNATAAARLRLILEKRDDEEALRLFGTLWSMEFRAVGLADQEAVRERVRKDVERLRAMDLEKRPWLVSELRQAYQSLSDEAGVAWADEHMPKRGTSTMEMISKWQVANRKPDEDYTVYQERLRKQTEEWIRDFPDDGQVWYERFRALETADSVPIEQALEVADKWLQIYERRHSGPSPYISVANFLARQRMRFDQIPSLLEKGLKLQEPIPVSDLYPTRNSLMSSSSYDRESAARIYVQLKLYDRAHDVLDQLVPELEKQRPAESASASDKRNFAMRESSVYYVAERLAWAEGRQEDGLRYGRLHTLAVTITNPSYAESYRSTLLRRWKTVKGSEDGFDDWLGQPKPPVGSAPRAATASTSGVWNDVDKTLPEFKLQDAHGKTWRISDLKGKVTLVNLWATWCGPCRTELPYLQKLANRVHDRKDLAVLTLNVDDDPGLVLPFLSKNNYDFPVLAAADYVSGVIKELSIPRNWIVDTAGVLRQERVGFGSGDDHWIDETIAAMEKFRAAK